MDRTANAVWKGNLKEGNGTLDTQSGALKGTPYSFKARFEDESGKSGTNPEELIAAAHAGCFAMQFSHFLAENGTPADELDAKAVVTLVPGTGITGSALSGRQRAGHRRGEIQGAGREGQGRMPGLARRSAPSRCRSTPSSPDRAAGCVGQPATPGARDRAARVSIRSKNGMLIFLFFASGRTYDFCGML